MKSSTLDWRIQAVATVAEDVPAAYPGGPSHKKGSKVVLSSITKLEDGTSLHYLTPSAVALALSIAISAAERAVKIKPTASRLLPAPGGPANLLFDNSALYDYFEQCFVAATFSFQAIEAYSNYKIAYTLKGEFEVIKNGKSELLVKDELERRLSTDDKIDLVLPKLLNCASPKGREEWEAFTKLKRLRDSTIHLKSRHQWTTGNGVKYDDSPYSVFLRESPLQLPITAINLIKFFSGDPERPWLEGAEGLLSKDLPV